MSMGKVGEDKVTNIKKSITELIGNTPMFWWKTTISSTILMQ